MLARFCGMQRKYSRLRQKTTTAIARRTGSCMATQAGRGCASTSGWIAFLGVFRSHDMAGGRPCRFAGFVRIWTKTGLFCGPKAK